MKPLRFSRRVTTFRRIDGATDVRGDVQLKAYLDGDALRARLVKPSSQAFASGELEAAVDEACAALAGQTAAQQRRDLIIEAGRVEQMAADGDKILARECRTYLLVVSRGEVLTLEEKPLDGERTSPLQTCDRQAEAFEISGALPVVFGASAVLALVDYYLEITDRCRNEAACPALHPLLSVVEVTHSPYPPHNPPRDLLTGEEASPRQIIKEGALTLSDQLPPAHAFLLHPEQWSRPFAALANDGMCSLAIDFERRTPVPDRSLMVDSLVPLATGQGALDWQAECSFMDGKQRLATCAKPLLLRFDGLAALARLDGSLDAPVPALVRDPITGERYGFAPAVRTNLSATDLGISF